MKTRPRFVPLFFTLMGFFIFVISGCASLDKRLEAPRVQVSHIQVKDFRALEAVFAVELRVLNPNDEPIFVKGINCDLELNGKRFATGVARVETEIPAYGTATFSVTLYSSLLNIVGGVIRLQQEEKIRYKLSGRLSVEGGFFGPSSFRFEFGGELSLN
ncbi:MAG: LEA type 2 family protein [Deltaproteobacteria bacterium]|nr:LEA type 2 family protein [Deltaproteobacteria bacterium]